MADPVFDPLPPDEAVAAFRAKGFHVGYDWRDTDAAQHTRSFTVAKAMRLDILQDIRGAVDEAIAEGATFEAFAARLEPLLREKGWWGRQMMTDPETGETREVQLGSVRRLRTIFDTNIRMAYAGGRWDQIRRLADRRPYLRYVGILDGRIRPQHAAWHGTVLRWDHPFWETHWPPNGWHCRCTVQSLSERDLERYGYTVGPPPDDWQRTRPWQNRRTGERAEVPVGIDPGFAHNAGTVDPVADAARLLDERLRTAPPALARAARTDVTAWIVRGREIRQGLVADTGLTSDAPGFNDRLRALVARGLTTARGAGTESAQAVPVADTPDHRAAAEAIEAASLRFPAAWVAHARRVPLMAISNGQANGGKYYTPLNEGDVAGFRKPRDEAWAVVARDPGNAVHEYVHHLQWTMPRVDALFQTLHRRRTTLPDGSREPVAQITCYDRQGRRDQYADEYFGAEYDAGMLADNGYVVARPALEVMPRAFQMLFHRLPIGYDLDWLVRRDPEMLDLALGLLFHYTP